MMLIGASALVAAASMLGDSAGYIDRSLDVLNGLMPKIMDAALAMESIGAILNSAALQLVLGCVYISMAGVVLQSSIYPLVVGAVLLSVTVQILLAAGLSFARVAMLILSASLSFVTAMDVIWLGSIMLSMAASALFDSAIMLMMVGSLLPGAVIGVMVGITMLAGAASLMWLTGGHLALASLTIYSSLMLMEFAVLRFSKTIDKIERVAGAMSVLASAFAALYSAPTRGLRNMADDALDVVPNVTKLGSGLSVAARKLDEGVRAFEGPAERLNGILSRLAETITTLGQGLNLTDDVGKLADMLDNYANLLENASARIETAVVTKVVPAMRAAEEAGIEETVRSEAITTVQVTHNDGAAREAQDESTRLLTKVSETLTTIKDVMAEMQSGGKGELTEIVAILQTYLPGLNKSDTGLSSEFNSWAK